MFTYDPGFTSTANCSSRITYIDGDKGELLYRGYPIDQLAENSNFLAVCYLLLNGDLPTNDEFRNFRKTINSHTMVHEQMTRFFTGFRRDAHPMAVMVGTVGALSAFYHDSTDINNPEHRIVATNRMIAKMPTIASMAYKYSIGQPFIYPRNDLDYTSNFSADVLRHSLRTVCRQSDRGPRAGPHLHPACRPRAERLDLDGAAWPAHRAPIRLRASRPASRACGDPRTAAPTRRRSTCWRRSARSTASPEYVKKAKDKTSGFRLMGFGHRVYKNYDPRAKVMQKTCHQVLDALDRHDDPLLKVAMELERIALQDEYFIEKKLYPNIDFYSGITLRAMGFPVSMFTVLFAVARTVGWIAQWKEMIEDPEQKIGRPRQLYVGAPRTRVSEGCECWGQTPWV